jgi:hypothetical protein
LQLAKGLKHNLKVAGLGSYCAVPCLITPVEFGEP